MVSEARIAPEELEAFIKDRWEGTIACPRCAETRWGVGSEEDLKALLPLGNDAASGVAHGLIGLPPQRYLPAFWLVCNHCGHVELIAAKIVRQWRGELSGAESG